MKQIFEIEIASVRVQDVLDEEPDDLDLVMQNSDFCDAWQVVASDIVTKFAGRKVKITVQTVRS